MKHYLGRLLLLQQLYSLYFSIFFFGGEILKGFSLAMILGVFFGTYSSIYIANPILVFLNVSQKTILKEDKD